jgi:hypothetical protein
MSTTNSGITKLERVIGDGQATEFQVAHSLGSGVVAQVWENHAHGKLVNADLSLTPEGVAVRFDSAPRTDEYLVVAIG